LTKPPTKKLGAAINDALEKSEDISKAIQDIRNAGYDVFLVIDATSALTKGPIPRQSHSELSRATTEVLDQTALHLEIAFSRVLPFQPFDEQLTTGLLGLSPEGRAGTRWISVMIGKCRKFLNGLASSLKTSCPMSSPCLSAMKQRSWMFPSLHLKNSRGDALGIIASPYRQRILHSHYGN